MEGEERKAREGSGDGGTVGGRGGEEKSTAADYGIQRKVAQQGARPRVGRPQEGGTVYSHGGLISPTYTAGSIIRLTVNVSLAVLQHMK